MKVWKATMGIVVPASYVMSLTVKVVLPAAA